MACSSILINDKHIGNFSYTEDNILIYTIYVSYIAHEQQDLEVRSYFEKFGAVSDFQIYNKKTVLTTFRNALITFKDAESASKALRHISHVLGKRRLDVQSAYSWKQPFQDQCLVKQNTENESNDLSILVLNDDVLFLIFKYLTLHDQINLSKISRRFENIFNKLLCNKKSLKIDVDQQLTLMDFRIVLQIIGAHIESIEFDCDSLPRYIDLTSQLCLNLKHLKLNSLRFQYNDIIKNIIKTISEIKTLTFLELPRSNISDEMIHFLSNIKTLENLDVSVNDQITGCYFDNFVNLKRLILYSCHKIQPESFVGICGKLKQITELNICNCYGLNNNDFDAIVNNLEVLETLTISTFYHGNIEKIAEIKSLKHLTVNFSQIRTENNNLWKKLAENKWNQLETLIVINFVDIEKHGEYILQLKKLKRLDLPFLLFLNSNFVHRIVKLPELKYLAIPSYQITKKDFLGFIKSSTFLEQIHVFNILEISEDFISELIDMLKFNGRKLKLLTGCSITKTVILYPKYVANQNLLKVHQTSSTYEFDFIDYPKYVANQNLLKVHQTSSTYEFDFIDFDNFDVPMIHYRINRN